MIRVEKSSRADKSGKSRLALTAPKPALLNFDRSEDWLLREMGLDNILRDRITLPPGEIHPSAAKKALTPVRAGRHARRRRSARAAAARPSSSTAARC